MKWVALLAERALRRSPFRCGLALPLFAAAIAAGCTTATRTEPARKPRPTESATLSPVGSPPATATPSPVGPIGVYGMPETQSGTPGHAIVKVDLGTGRTMQRVWTAGIATVVCVSVRPGPATEVWIAGHGAGGMELSVHSPGDLQATRGLGYGGGGAAAGELDFSADGSFAFVARSGGSAEILRVAADSMAVASAPLAFSAASALSVVVRPAPIGVVFVGSQLDGTVAVVDPATLAISATIAVGAGPGSATFAASGSYLYVPCDQGDVVSVLDAATYSVAATVALPPGCGAWSAVSRTRNHALVSCGASGEVVVMDSTSHAVVSSLFLGGAIGAIALDEAPACTLGFAVQDDWISVVRQSCTTQWTLWDHHAAPGLRALRTRNLQTLP